MEATFFPFPLSWTVAAFVRVLDFRLPCTYSTVYIQISGNERCQCLTRQTKYSLDCNTFVILILTNQSFLLPYKDIKQAAACLVLALTLIQNFRPKFSNFSNWKSYILKAFGPRSCLEWRIIKKRLLHRSFTAKNLCTF